MSLRDAPNLNALWGSLIVEELVRQGVTYFVVAPGSRSTPLAQAIARNPRAHAASWLDERGAAFHAVGWARATGKAAAVITTSGTAVANLLPAAIEASLDGVPLILLTADRPHELREVGANQSVSQVGLFGDHVRWSFDLPVPTDTAPARMVLTAVDHAVARAESGFPGPVQLNCPYREPLAPDAEPWSADCLAGLEGWLASEAPFTRGYPMDGGFLAGDDVQALVDDMLATERGLVIVGAAPAGPGATPPLSDANRCFGWPVWADVRSGLRCGWENPALAVHLDRFVGAGYEPEIVIQLGARITSRRLRAWLDEGRMRRYVLVDRDPGRRDPGHGVTDRIVARPAEWLETVDEMLAMMDRPIADRTGDVPARSARAEDAVEMAVEAGDALTEPWVARRLTRCLDPAHGLFSSSSMPIRDLQAYAALDGAPVHVDANRGASGIDGVLSTAAGFAQGRDTPVTLLIGDLALLHDANALAMLAPLEQPLTIVVLNNGGGSIFSFLPVAEYTDVLTPLVNTPHDFTFEGVCAAFRLSYVRVETRAAFDEAYASATASGAHAVIEVASGLEANLAHHRAIEAAVEADIAKGLRPA